MNFGLLHRFLLWALACSGLLVLWTAGVPHSFQGYLALGLVGIAGLMPNEWTRRPVMRRVTSTMA